MRYLAHMLLLYLLHLLHLRLQARSDSHRLERRKLRVRYTCSTRWSASAYTFCCLCHLLTVGSM